MDEASSNLLGSPSVQAVRGLGLRLRDAAVLYCSSELAEEFFVWPPSVDDVLAGEARSSTWMPHGADRPGGWSSPSRSMVRLTSALSRTANRRFRCPDKHHPHQFKFCIDPLDSARAEIAGCAVPRALGRMVGASLTDKSPRLWLRDLAAVIWVCAWPWGEAWAASRLHKNIISRDPALGVWLDREQARGAELGTALAEWHHAKRPNLEQALAVYKATRPIREAFAQLVSIEFHHSRVCKAAQQKYWIERTRRREGANLDPTRFTASMPSQAPPRPQEDPFIEPPEPQQLVELRLALAKIGEIEKAARS